MKTLLIAAALGASMLTVTAAMAGTPQTPATQQPATKKKAEAKPEHTIKKEEPKENKGHVATKTKAHEEHKGEMKATPATHKEAEKTETKKANPVR